MIELKSIDLEASLFHLNNFKNNVTSNDDLIFNSSQNIVYNYFFI